MTASRFDPTIHHVVPVSGAATMVARHSDRDYVRLTCGLQVKDPWVTETVRAVTCRACLHRLGVR